MKIISWNCQGLENLRSVRDLCQMVKVKQPKMVFLMETKLRQNKMEVIKLKAGFDNVFTVNCVGRSGGLALLWKNEMEVTIQNYNRRHISTIVEPFIEGVAWKFIGFCGHLEASKRKEAWNLLCHLKTFLSKPWLFVGDFNEIVAAFEKR
jgi:exonuclease III